MTTLILPSGETVGSTMRSVEEESQRLRSEGWPISVEPDKGVIRVLGYPPRMAGHVGEVTPRAKGGNDATD